MDSMAITAICISLILGSCVVDGRPTEQNVLCNDSAVNVFPQSFNLLVNWSDDDTLDSIRRLTEVLECYSLPMQQAAAYITQNFQSELRNQNHALAKEIYSYMEKVEQRAKRLLDLDIQLPQFKILDTYSKTTFLTLTISLDKIRETPELGTEAIELLNVISFFAPHNISTEFLKHVIGTVNNLDSNYNSLQLLQNYSIIKISEEKISVDPLVQEITRLWLEKENEYVSTLDSIILHLDNNLDGKEIHPLDQIIHAVSVWNFAVKNPEVFKKYPDFSLRISHTFYKFRKYHENMNFISRAIPAMESILGMDSRTSLKIKYEKGCTLQKLVDYEDSLSLLLEVYGRQKKLFGADDEDSLATGKSIGTVYNDLENYEEAIKWLEDALEKSIKINGKDHSDTWTIKNDIAYALYEQDKNEEAMKLYNEVLEYKMQVLGKDDPGTLDTKTSIAIILLEQEEYQEALITFQEILGVKEKVLDADDPSILNTKSWIASTYLYFGKIDDALHLIKEVYEKRTQLLGPQDPQTISSYEFLEELWKLISERERHVLRVNSAVEFLQQSFNLSLNSTDESNLEIIEKVCEVLPCYPLAVQQEVSKSNISKNIPSNIHSLKKEINDYLEKKESEAQSVLDDKTGKIPFGKIEETPEIGKEAIEILKIVSFLAPDNISIELLTNVSIYFDNVNFNSNSLQLPRNYSTISIDDKISVQPLVQEITRIYLEDKNESIPTLDKLIRCMEKLWSDEDIQSDQMVHFQSVFQFATKHPEILKKYPKFSNKICCTLFSSGKYQEAFNFITRALPELESILGMDNRQTLKMKYWKGVVLTELGEYKDSLSLLLKVYEKQKELLGEGDRHTLATAREIGGHYSDLQNYEEAIRWYRTTLEISLKIKGEDHSETISIKNDLAVALRGQGNDEEAMKLFKEVLETEERTLGKDHTDILITKSNIASVLYDQYKYEEALKDFQQVLGVRKKVLPKDHPDTLKTKRWIARVYQRLGRIEEAFQLAKEVHEKQMEILGPQHPDTIGSNNLVEYLEWLIPQKSE